MGATEFASTDAQAVKRWSNALAREAIGKTYFRRFLGKGEDSIIQLHTDLENAPGDEIKYDVLYAMRGDGVQGDTTLEGYEEELQFYPDAVKIDQLRNAVSYRSMSQQRTVHAMRTTARTALSQWYARMYDALMFAYLAGTAGTGAENVSGTLGASGFAGNAITAVDATHVVDSGASAFTVDHLDVAKSKAAVINPRIRPTMVNGKPRLVAVLHPYQVDSMRRDAGTRGWHTIHEQIAEGGKDNPIYTGALGVHNGVVIHESEFIPRAGDVNYGVLLGAQAGAFAMGNAYKKANQSKAGGGSYFSWVEQERDYGNKQGVGVASCFGIKRNIFNSLTFGSMLLQSTDSEPSV